MPNRYVFFGLVSRRISNASTPGIELRRAAAARKSVSSGEPAAWTLFLIMFLWQLPHFLAIAWIYKEDYARAGLPMLPVVDKSGAVTGRQAMVWAATLLLFSLMPVLVGLTTMTFVIVYTVLFPIVLNTVLGVESVHRDLARAGSGSRQY